MYIDIIMCIPWVIVTLSHLDMGGIEMCSTYQSHPREGYICTCVCMQAWLGRSLRQWAWLGVASMPGFRFSHPSLLFVWTYLMHALSGVGHVQKHACHNYYNLWELIHKNFRIIGYCRSTYCI